MLGVLLSVKGEYAAAEPLCLEVLAARCETLGNRHRSTLLSMNNLSALQIEKGDLAGAEQLLREILDGQREMLGAQHPDTLDSIECLTEIQLLREDTAAERLTSFLAEFDLI